MSHLPLRSRECSLDFMNPTSPPAQRWGKSTTNKHHRTQPYARFVSARYVQAGVRAKAKVRVRVWCPSHNLTLSVVFFNPDPYRTPP